MRRSQLEAHKNIATRRRRKNIKRERKRETKIKNESSFFILLNLLKVSIFFSLWCRNILQRCNEEQKTRRLENFRARELFLQLKLIFLHFSLVLVNYAAQKNGWSENCIQCRSPGTNLISSSPSGARAFIVRQGWAYITGPSSPLLSQNADKLGKV